ncbi:MULTISPECIES: SDR family NAD(P)-dependent oxidoreductase [Zhongshania]|jgi:NAD(P)-dependent dehydrogenase (short-subunit alcohol dehydrogenase family)|uniref:NAD(P)-dependent dehydrogenase (Short-subunit alcohol dehydrogenase family) n=1 Tax=Zhongshania antarctica TaxID=641702 RepID=A0A840R2E8_9GAMM|nr:MULTISPECIES: SDR family NAD(P)-dependent oxidoreductase [Zhongshania]MBB5186581.1 NAD(P)-dependent dehydrogenase (short-subunit alcohol dehydrogenase family) [Zhongshania antarctica]
MLHTLDERITVKRKLADCFAYLRDFSTIEQWDPSVLSAHKITAGSVIIGSQYQLELKMPGAQHIAMHYTQLAIKEQELLVLEGHGTNFTALDTLHFKALNANTTEIHYRAELNFEGLSSPAYLLLKPILNRIGKNAARGLKQALEIPDMPKKRLKDRIGDHLLVPAALNFGRRGYLRQPRKSHASRLDGKVIAITGPTAGLGLSAASELSRLGADLILIGRDKSRLNQSAKHIMGFSGCRENQLSCYEIDFSNLENTANLGRRISTEHPCIDVLINNAGALFNAREVSDEGFERSIAVNFLAPTLLTNVLSPSLHKDSRVINVVSGGLYTQGLALDDMQFCKPPYNGSKAYARAKRALLTMSQHTETTAIVHNMHPGWAATPGLAKSLPAFNKALRPLLRDSRMGADTMVWLASAPELANFRHTRLWFDRQIHTDTVLPGTGSTKSDIEKLRQWSNDVLFKYLKPKEHGQFPTQQSADLQFLSTVKGVN